MPDNHEVRGFYEMAPEDNLAGVSADVSRLVAISGLRSYFAAVAKGRR